MKPFINISFLFFISISLLSQENSTSKKLYDPSADAKSEIANAIAQAKKENKHVFLQVGGNWCSWCIAFDK